MGISKRNCKQRMVRGLMILMMVLLVSTAYASPQTIKVGEGHKFSALQQAFDAANDGDTVKVFGGRYKESPLILDKSIALIGHDMPVIDGENDHETLKIEADSVHVKGFRFVGSGVSHTSDNAALRFNRVVGGKVTDNVLDSNYFGIYLAKAHNMTIRNNKIQTHHQRESMSANGIHLWDTKDATIEDNNIRGHRDGIYFEYVENSTISGNISEENLRYGLHFMFSDSCAYTDNAFINNGAGVAVMYTDDVLMKNNKFLDNWGTSSYGLLLKDINDSHIEENIFRNNTLGIRKDGSNRTTIKRNEFRNNGWGVKVLSNAMDNRFTENNFIDNTFDVSTNSRQNYSEFNYNYWSKYSGYDLDGDGKGDVPYRPVRLFSLIIEQNPIALILLRSFFIEILDMAERIMPVLTPETLVDENPAMKAFDLYDRRKISDEEIREAYSTE